MTLEKLGNTENPKRDTHGFYDNKRVVSGHTYPHPNRINIWLIRHKNTQVQEQVDNVYSYHY